MEPTAHLTLKDFYIPLATFFVSVVALVIPILSERLKHMFFFPNLEVVFFWNNEFVKETPDTWDNDPNKTYDAIYYRLCLRNNSSNSAKNVQMYLVKIATLNDDNNLVDILTDPFELVWSYRDNKPIDIPGRMYFFFDLFNLSTEYPKRFSVQTRKRPHSLRMYNSRPGAYVFTISVGYENNYKPKNYNVYVNFVLVNNERLMCQSLTLEREQSALTESSVFKEFKPNRNNRRR